MGYHIGVFVGARTMALDTRYLEFHGAQWRVQMKVPHPLRSTLGKSKLVEPLHTDSLATANKLRWPILAKFKTLIADAERGLAKGVSSSRDPLVKDALDWRRDTEEAQRNPELYAEYNPEGELIADSHTVMRSFISDRAEEISKVEGPRRAALFQGIAGGTATPIMLLVDTWLSERPVKPRQKMDYRRAVAKFDAFLLERKGQAVVERVNRRMAGEYVSVRMADGTHPKTLNKDVSALSTYWRWLEAKGYIEANVWVRQGVAKKELPRSQGKRPFRDEEIKTLLVADAPRYLTDAIRVAALSGMRVEEIARLKVRDCQGGLFEIHEAKTKAGERIVPIHSRLKELIARRVKGKKPGEYLFDELPTPSPQSASERSQKISKRFTDLRRRIGLDDRIEGSRQARADFHSLRRWFIRKAGDALQAGVRGFSPWTIAQVVGHEGGSLPLAMTMVKYRGEDSEGALRACVETVKLPK
jgi:integrase